MTNTSSGKDFLSLLKSIGGGIIGVIGFVTSLIAFINLAIGNKGIATITMLIVGIGAIEVGILYIYLKKRKPEERVIISPLDSFNSEEKWSYSKKTRLLALSLAVVIPASIAIITALWMYKLNHPTHKFIILVTNFDGPEQDKYRTTDILVDRLRKATQKYSEVEIQALNQSIIEQQGPVEARRIGEEHKASIVLWGWYGKTNSNVLLTIHFEILSKPKSLQLEREPQPLNVTLADMESFQIQTNLSNEMSYLTLLIIGLERFDADDYVGAIERFTDAVNLPANLKDVISPAVVYFYRGNGYFSENDLGNAIADYSKALSINTDYTEASFNRGFAYDNQGEHDLAIKDYSKAISKKTDYIEAYNNRGMAYWDKNEYDLAFADFNKALSINPDWAESLNNRGMIYWYKGEYDLAIDDYTKAMSFNPNYAQTYYNRGIAYEDKGEYDLAIDDYTKAIIMKPDYVKALNNRGTVYRYKYQFDLAIDDYTKAIGIRPDSAYVFNNRGMAYEQKREGDLAIADYTKTLSIDPNFYEAYNNRGMAYWDKNEYDLALADFNKALSIKPDYVIALNNRGMFYLDKEEYDLAIADFKKAKRLNRTNAQDKNNPSRYRF